MSNALVEAANEVCAFMAEHRWEFCIIGGLAVQQWGEPRTTLDADITLLTGWGEEDLYASAILGSFESRIADGREFAVTNRVLLIRASNGTDVDISLGALPFEAEMMRRSVAVEFAPGIALPCCSAEDLFIMKAYASRSRDRSDAEGIVARQNALDKRYILRQLEDLCALKEAPEILAWAKVVLDELE